MDFQLQTMDEYSKTWNKNKGAPEGDAAVAEAKASDAPAVEA